jgi:hypothetical protein
MDPVHLLTLPALAARPVVVATPRRPAPSARRTRRNETERRRVSTMNDAFASLRAACGLPDTTPKRAVLERACALLCN